MRYRLHTLLILLALGPPVIAWTWIEYTKYRTLQRQREALKEQFSVPAAGGSRVVVPGSAKLINEDFPGDPSQ